MRQVGRLVSLYLCLNRLSRGTNHSWFACLWPLGLCEDNHLLLLVRFAIMTQAIVCLEGFHIHFHRALVIVIG